MKSVRSLIWSGRGMKSLRSFARQEPRKMGNLLVIACMLLSLCVLSLIKSRYCPSPYVGSQEPRKLQLPMKSEVKVETEESVDSAIIDEDEEDPSKSVNASQPICYEVSSRSDTCEAGGDIRVQASSSTIFIDPSSAQQEWKIKPYARKGDQVALANVKEWVLKPLTSHEQLPHCTTTHSVPAVIFSVGGFTGNLFHDFTDVLVPLFITSHQFQGEVQLLVADYKSWWVNKFMLIFKQLSNYEIIDVEKEKDEVRCFPKVITGLSFHSELGIDQSKTPKGHSILDFKDLLRSSFGLERGTAMAGDGSRRPRLLIIARKRSRVFVNEKGMVAMASSLGFDVRVAEPDVSTDLSKFARLVNSVDVMIGVHGAGLTNMVFLPLGAVLIQVIPLGGLEWLAKDSFKNPAIEMKLNYMEYRIQEDESTLSDQYPKDHPVLKDPVTVRQQGWDALKSVYLDKQNVKLNLGRLKNTLLEALKLLPTTDGAL